MTLKYIWRSFQPSLSFPRQFQHNFKICIMHVYICIASKRKLSASKLSATVDRRATATVLKFTAGLQRLALFLFIHFLGRPYGVTGGLIKCSWCFFFFRHAFYEVPRPIAAKLSHTIGNWLDWIMQVQKFGGPSPQKNLGAKNMQNFGRFYTTSDFDR